LRLERPAEVRLRLQRGAPANVRQHVRRAVVRLAVLVAVDMLSFGVMRELLRAVREHALLGAAVAERIQLGFPTGSLNGWQYAIDTLFVGPAGECIAAASSPAFATGTDYRPIGFVDVHIPPAPGALGHVSDMPLLLAASGAQVVALCGYVTDKQFQDVVDVA